MLIVTEQGQPLGDIKDARAEAQQEEVAKYSPDQAPPSREELSAVRCRIDLHLLPVMVGTYAIQFYGQSSVYADTSTNSNVDQLSR
jgi:hypothetical protein